MQFLRLSLGEGVNQRIEYYATIAGGNCTLLPITISVERGHGVRQFVRTKVASVLAMLLSSLIPWA